MDAADDDVAVVLVAAGSWKRFCGEVCLAIYQVAVEVGDRAAAGAVVAASVAAASVAAVVAVLAEVLVVETHSVEVVRVAVGSRPAERYDS